MQQRVYEMRIRDITELKERLIDVWRGLHVHAAVAPPQKIFRFLGSKRRVLVHLWCYFLQLINLNLHI